METAVVLRQREAQQLQRAVKKLVLLVDRLVVPGKDGDGMTVPKARRVRRVKVEEGV